MATLTERIRDLAPSELREELARVGESAKKIKLAAQEETKALVHDALTIGAAGAASYVRWSETIGHTRKPLIEKVDNSVLVGAGALVTAMSRQFDRETSGHIRAIGRGALAEATANWARKRAQDDLREPKK